MSPTAARSSCSTYRGGASIPLWERSASSRVESIVEAALARSDRGGEALSMTVGVGTAHPGPTGIGLSAQEAISAARAAGANSIHNRPDYFDQLGFGQAHTRWYEIDGVRATIEDLIKPVLALHPEKAQVALETLHAYLDCERSISATADAFHVHRFPSSESSGKAGRFRLSHGCGSLWPRSSQGVQFHAIHCRMC